MLVPHAPRSIMFKLIVFIFFASSLFGCVASGRVVDGNGVVYSEYYENISFIESPKLKVHAIETLGNERLPENYTLSKGDRDFLKSPDAIKTVFEVYVTNNSENIVEVIFGKFRSGGFWGDFGAEKHTVMPGKFIKSSAYVSVTSTYKAIKGTYELELTINGEKHNLSGEINRAPVK
jgi:hypothetical protein